MLYPFAMRTQSREASCYSPKETPAAGSGRHPPVALDSPSDPSGKVAGRRRLSAQAKEHPRKIDPNRTNLEAGTAQCGGIGKVTEPLYSKHGR